MKTAVEAFKLSNGLFVIPFLMAYTPLLFVDELAWFDVAGAAAGGAAEAALVVLPSDATDSALRLPASASPDLARGALAAELAEAPPDCYDESSFWDRWARRLLENDEL